MSRLASSERSRSGGAGINFSGGACTSKGTVVDIGFLRVVELLGDDLTMLVEGSEFFGIAVAVEARELVFDSVFTCVVGWDSLVTACGGSSISPLQAEERMIIAVKALMRVLVLK